MAKDRHRIFEIYESCEEAAWELMPKAQHAANANPASESWSFKQITVSQLVGITHVKFKESSYSSDKAVAELQDDLTQLADDLSGDSRVLIDFEGVQTFGPAGINSLILFNKKLHVRGSRMVLCGFDANVRASFF